MKFEWFFLKMKPGTGDAPAALVVHDSRLLSASQQEPSPGGLWLGGGWRASSGKPDARKGHTQCLLLSPNPPHSFKSAACVTVHLAGSVKKIIISEKMQMTQENELQMVPDAHKSTALAPPRSCSSTPLAYPHQADFWCPLGWPKGARQMGRARPLS